MTHGNQLAEFLKTIKNPGNAPTHKENPFIYGGDLYKKWIEFINSTESDFSHTRFTSLLEGNGIMESGKKNNKKIYYYSLFN